MACKALERDDLVPRDFARSRKGHASRWRSNSAGLTVCSGLPQEMSPRSARYHFTFWTWTSFRPPPADGPRPPEWVSVGIRAPDGSGAGANSHALRAASFRASLPCPLVLGTTVRILGERASLHEASLSLGTCWGMLYLLCPRRPGGG